MHTQSSTSIRWLLVLTLVLTLLGAFVPGRALAAQPPDAYIRMQAVERALNWLLTQQADDGSFGGSASATIEVVFAASAAERDLETWHAAASVSPLDFLASVADSYTTDVGSTGKLMAAVAAANRNPRDFGGLDLVERLKSQLAALQPGSETAIGEAWAAIGLAAAGEAIPASIINTLAALQQSDGGWEWGPGFGTDSNTSAVVLQALLAAGLSADNPVVIHGLAYLQAQLSPQGGFTYSSTWGSAADANSTAVVIQALLASKEDITASKWCSADMDPLNALMSWQLESGAFEWQPGQGANLLATAQAVPALLGRTLPIKSASIAAQRALKALQTWQQPDGSFSSTSGSNLGLSSQVLLALAAAGEDPEQWMGSTGKSLLDYLQSQAGTNTDVGVAGRLVAGLVLAGINPYRVDASLVPTIKQAYRADVGLYDPSGNIWNQALAIWGLCAVNEQVPQPAVNWLLANQNADGGWGWAAGQTSDSNSTAVVMQALGALGYTADDQALSKAISYLRSQQTADGGFAYDISSSSVSDANSDAAALQGLLSAGIDASLGFAWAKPSIAPATPLRSLLALQTADGSFAWQPGMAGDVYSTAQAIPALLKAVIPPRQANRAVTSIPLELNASTTDSLLGSNAGAFRYYVVTTPEARVSLTLSLTGLPGDPLASKGLGFAAYNASSQVAAAQASSGSATAAFTSDTAQTIIIQVYNYLPDIHIQYHLAVSSN